VWPAAGFDIYFSPKHGTNQGFAALRGHRRQLPPLRDQHPHRAPPTTWAPSPQNRQVTDLALPLNQHWHPLHDACAGAGGRGLSLVWSVPRGGG
jgi:hypothetical protein